MLPPRFEYHRPTTLDEALQLLSDLGEDAKVLAGGQSLIPLLKLRLASPAHLIDVNRIEGLAGITETRSEIRIGALTRHHDLETSEVLRSRAPTIAAAAPMIADPLVRNMGTIGGSLAHADPAGDLGSVMLSLGATVIARSASGEREIPIRGFLRSTFETSLGPSELVTEIRVPVRASTGGTYLKLERRVGDFATVGVAVTVTMADGAIGRAGIGLTGVGLTNIQAEEAERALAGATPGDEAYAEAGRLAAEASNPSTDVRGSAGYKRHIVDVYVRRGLARAVEAARAA
jgi:carbon-monoxide dehydrogenase medium subunit